MDSLEALRTTKISTSLPGAYVTRSKEPNTTTSSTNGSETSSDRAYSSTAARTSASSTDLITTELDNGFRIRDRFLRLLLGVEVDRSTPLEPVWVASGNVVLV